MKHQIIENLNKPDTLEQMYRENKENFKRSFTEISGTYSSDLISFWKLRLAPEKETGFKELFNLNFLIVLILSFLSGLLIKLPEIFSGIDQELFYQRNLSVIVFNAIILFTCWQTRIFNTTKIVIYGSIILFLVLFVNFLPSPKSDSAVLVFIHVPLFLWCMFGLAYVSFDHKNIAKRIDFIRFNGELLIMTGLIIIAGGLLTVISVGLFSAIKINIENFYFDYVVVFGGVAAPIVAYYLIRLYPNITSMISPVIARIFTPLVLITLFIYLVTLTLSPGTILEDRDLLVLFNVMLLAVMGLIIFSVSELDKIKGKNFNVLILLLLAGMAIVINSIALIAIITRISDGLTPNRIVVLISNVLVFINLILIAKSLYQSYFKNKQLEAVEFAVAKYLPVYFIWTIVVIFVLPFVFGLK